MDIHSILMLQCKSQSVLLNIIGVIDIGLEKFCTGVEVIFKDKEKE